MSVKMIHEKMTFPYQERPSIRTINDLIDEARKTYPTIDDKSVTFDIEKSGNQTFIVGISLHFMREETASESRKRLYYSDKAKSRRANKKTLQAH